ncbi:hypothetical protein L484_008456 [Morus notabilis]|uniref:Uncharacterized protein n=1 Tax=Morus notabilis TaxID=981085 RepID=W9RYB1_9ROSA|nr:hypothetical protein L484_008456 [Morus notabilis]
MRINEEARQWRNRKTLREKLERESGSFSRSDKRDRITGKERVCLSFSSLLRKRREKDRERWQS